MSDPKRLADGGGSPAARALLRSARVDAPARGARQRALVALGGAATAATVASGAQAAGGAAAAIGKGASLGLVKFFGVIGLLGATAVGAAAVHAELSSEDRPAPVLAPRAIAPIASAATAIATAEAPVFDPPAPPASSPPPVARPAPIAAPVAAPSATATASAAPDTSLAAEIGELDRARQALDENDPARAKAILDAHDKRFAQGSFAPEAVVLRIEALARAGDGAGARALADGFLAQHPDSPYAPRVRSAAAAAKP